MDITGKETTPGDYESNFKKVDAIPSEPSRVSRKNSLSLHKCNLYVLYNYKVYLIIEV